MKCDWYPSNSIFLLIMIACVLISQNLFAIVGFNGNSISNKSNLAYISDDTLVATTNVFEIIVSGVDSILGNGIDEETHWRFTFDLPSNDTTLQIISALLTINLTPMDPLANNDGVWLRGCNCGQIDVGEHTLFEMYTFEAELLNTFPAQFILDSLLTSGGISLGYQDDATVSFAQLQLIIQSPTGVEDSHTSKIPKNYSLEQNYPNPFNPSTRIKYQVSSISHISLKVYDVLGNEIATLVNEEKPAGNYEVNFSAAKLSSGIYFYKLQAGSLVETKKMILLR